MVTKNSRLFAIATVFPLVLFSRMSHAEEDAATDFSIIGISENFRWQEFRPKSTQIMEETGQRAGVGASWSNGRNPEARGPVYRASAVFYGGISQYLGDTLISNGVADKTTGSYYGALVDAIGGYRFGSHVGFEFFSGIGFDVWKHVLDGSLTPGYGTLFGAINGKLGVGTFMAFQSWGIAIRGGLKAPLFMYEHVDAGNGVDLAPKPQASFFGAAEFTSGSYGHDTFSVTGYVDGYNFGASSYKPVTINGVTTSINQPLTKYLIAGVRVGINF